MKKLLVVMLVLSLASLANAQLLISINGDHGVTEVTVNTGTVLTIDVWGDGATAPNQYIMGMDAAASTGTGTLDISQALMLYTGNKTAIMTASGNGDSFDWTVDGDGVEMLMDDVPAIGLPKKPLGPGVLVDQILFTCTGLGDVVLALGDPDFARMDDTLVTIHQTPEPITVALLGLGGLFLRRRK